MFTDHPNVKAFVTHGGLLSVTEAVYYAVPIVGIPAFADQQYNIRNAVHRKFAVEFTMNNMNERDFTNAIKEVLENPVYIFLLTLWFSNSNFHIPDIKKTSRGIRRYFVNRWYNRWI